MGPKKAVIFVRYNREFVITVIVVTEFDCTFESNMSRNFLGSEIGDAKWKVVHSPQNKKIEIVADSD